MDTSETYVKMCEQVEEIQAQKREERHKNTGKWIAGDFWTTVFRDGVFIVPSHEDFWAEEPHYTHHPVECIWLPRQDQLQEMIKSIESSARILWCVGCWCNHNRYAEQFTSMEQLWLAFVMSEKWGKQWIEIKKVGEMLS